MPSEQDKWLGIYDGQCQLKFQFILQAYFESILKPVYEQYREKTNKMKTERVREK